MSRRRALAVSAMVLVAYLLQTALIATMSWPLVGPDLFLLVVLGWLLHLPQRDAVITGFAAGLLLDLAPPVDGPLGKWALILTVSALLISRTGTGVEAPLVRVGVLGGASALLVASGYVVSSILGEGQAAASLPITIIGIGLWNVVFAPGVLMAVRRAMRGTVPVEVLR